MFHIGSVFKKFLVSYLIVVSLPVLFGMFLYIFLYGTIRDNQENLYKSSLAQSQRTIEQYFDEIDNIKQQILLNPQVEKHFSPYKPGSFTVYETRNFLSPYLYSSPMIDNIYLYSADSDTMTDCNTTFSLSDFYGRNFSVGDYDYLSFRNQILYAHNYKTLYPSQSVNQFGDRKDELLYISNVPLGQLDRGNGCIIITIPRAKIIEKFEQSIKAQGHFYIIDKTGNILVSSDGAPAIDIERAEDGAIVMPASKKQLIYQSQSDSGMTYIATMPYTVVTEQLKGIKLYMSLGFLAIVVIDFLVIWIFARRNSNPIRALLQSFGTRSRSGRETDELALLSDNIDRLIRTNELERDEMEKNIPLLTSGFTQNLLYGNLLSREDIQWQAERLGISLHGHYAVILVCIPPDGVLSLEAISAIKAVVKKRLISTQEMLCSDLSELDAAFIAIVGEDGQDSVILRLESVLSEVGDELFASLHVRLRVAFGAVCDCPENIFYSYHDAKESLTYGIQTVYHNVEWYVKSPSNSQGYYYPLDIELRIVTAIANHKFELASDSVALLRTENMENRILTVDNILQLFQDLKGTVYKIINELPFTIVQKNETEEKLRALDTIRSLDAGFDCFLDTLAFLSRCLKNAEKQDDSSAIFDYIERNFMNPSLSRQTFAEHFHITTEYASTYFKEHTGFNFVEYVEKVRIENACKMLSDKNMKIEEIAAATGYHSALSFRRAFKRYTQMTPTEYAKTRFGSK